MAGRVGMAKYVGPHRNAIFDGSALMTMPVGGAASPMSKNQRGGNGFIVTEHGGLYSPPSRHQLRHRLRGLLQRPEKLLHHLLRGMPLRVAADVHRRDDLSTAVADRR